MPKPKTKDAKITSFSLDVEVLNKLDDYCKKTYVPKTKVVELAISKYVDEMSKSQAIADENN